MNNPAIPSSSTITLDQLKEHFGYTHLSWDAIDVKSMDYTFDSDHWDEDGEEGWLVAHHPSLESQLEDLSTVDLPGTRDRDPMVSAGAPEEDGDITLYFAHGVEDMNEEQRDALLVRINEDLKVFDLTVDEDDLESEELTVCRRETGWDKLLPLWELTPELWEEDADETEQWDPMMNQFYPLPQGDRGGDCWHRRMHCMTLVRVNGMDGLALTGGGMDMRWSIARTYLSCGYLPPYEIATRLPRMAGAGTSLQHKMVLAACRIAIERTRDWAIGALEALVHLEESSEEFAAKRAS